MASDLLQQPCSQSFPYFSLAAKMFLSSASMPPVNFLGVIDDVVAPVIGCDLSSQEVRIFEH